MLYQTFISFLWFLAFHCQVFVLRKIICWRTRFWTRGLVFESRHLRSLCTKVAQSRPAQINQEKLTKKIRLLNQGLAAVRRCKLSNLYGSFPREEYNLNLNLNLVFRCSLFSILAQQQHDVFLGRIDWCKFCLCCVSSSWIKTTNITSTLPITLSKYFSEKFLRNILVRLFFPVLQARSRILKILQKFCQYFKACQ